jgi:hypothetical protein
MIRVCIPNDGDCLFTAIDYLINGITRENGAIELRQECVNVIKSNPYIYNELLLGDDPNEYINKLGISQGQWGGELEINILAKLKNIQISVVSLDNSRILTYSPNNNECTSRIYILYRGQHYEALINEQGYTIFDISDVSNISEHEASASNCATNEKVKLDIELRTRIRKKIKCIECNIICNDFQIHCEEAEHSDEFDYSCEEVEIEELVESRDDN